MMMLCNSNLFNVATDAALDLPQYVRSRAFNRRTWYPEGMVLTVGKGAGQEPVSHGVGKHPLGKKTIADVSEAIIGASLLATRQDKNKFDLGIRAISKLVESKDHKIESWNDFAKLYKADPPEWPQDVQDPVAKDLADKIRKRMGYTFRCPRLLRSAFTHPSDQHTPVPDYQRLEFLGDAVLDMVCINWLFNKFENRNPQWLTEHKMAMVSNKFLAAVAVVLGFDKFISATTTKLLVDISRYAEQVRSVMKAGGDCLRRDFWTEIDEPPKALSDLVESYLGAVIVDSEFDYGEAELFFEKHLLWFFEDMEIYDSFANRHPTTFLHKKLTNYGCMNYKLMCSDQPEGPVAVRIIAGVVVHEHVVATAESSGARYAKVRASQKCLQILEGMSVAQFREKFQCDCRHVSL
jgi:endoribonuclease Dicer